MSYGHTNSTTRRAAAATPSARRGLSLPEALISLTIIALLLTAAASAFNASADAVEANDRFFRATQSARIAMHHILTEARTGSVDEVWGPDWLRVVTSETYGTPRDITFRYRPDLRQLLLVTNNDLTDRDYVLASNVESLRFNVELGKDYTGVDCVAHVAVAITVRVGDHKVNLSGSASPRRNLVF